MKKAILISFLSARLLVGQAAATLKTPIALDKLPSGDLFALTQGSGVYRFHLNGLTLTPSGSFSLPSTQTPSDIVSAIANREQTIFIAAQSSSGGSIFQYSLDGRLLSTWTAQHTLSGLDFDYSTNTLYVAQYDSPEILCTPLSNRSGNLQACGTIIGARQLGPVIVDASRQQLLVGDLQNGEVFTFSLKTHKSHLLTGGLGSPQGLLLSSDHNQLFIADAVRRKIYRLDISKPTASPVVFSAEPAFREPVGLALLTSGNIVVADDRANALFLLLPTGQSMNAASPNLNTDSLLEEHTLKPFQTELLTADVFGGRVCIAAGHMTKKDGYVDPFHIYIYTSSQKLTSCPDHDQIKDARNAMGNMRLEVHSVGTRKTFSFPTAQGSNFSLRIKAIDPAVPNVVIEVSQSR